MSNKLYINRLYIENFKTIDKAVISFEDQDITVLDGPNGFGKTTIFDSIELVLTGQIKRIQNFKVAVTARGYRDYLFAKNQNKPVVVKIELKSIGEDSSKKRVFARRIDPTKLRSTGKKPFEFNYELHELNTIDDEMTVETVTNEQELEKFFKVNDFIDRYSLYHYVEQEDSSHLFKKNEKERIEVISKLFNIQKENEQKEKLDTTRRVLRRKLRDINKDIEKYKGFVTEKDSDADRTFTQVEYIKLLPATSKKPWDSEKLNNLDKVKKDTYISELNQIIKFKKYFEDYIKQKKNNNISQVIANKGRLSALIVLGFYNEEFETFKKEYETNNNLKRYLKVLEERSILTSYINWDIIFETLKLKTDKQLLIDRIDHIKSLNKTTNNLSNTVRQLLEARESLKNQFNNLISSKSGSSNDQNCPYCGQDWKSFKELEEQMEQKTIEIQQNLDQNSNKVVEEINNLYSAIIKDIINQLDSYLSDDSRIKDDFFLQLQEYKNLGIDVNKAKLFLDNIGIISEEYYNKEKKIVSDLEERTNSFVSDLESRMQNTEEFTRDNFKLLQEIFINTFNSDFKLVEKIRVEDIELKKLYIENAFYDQSNWFFKELQKLTIQRKKLDSICINLDGIIEIYTKKINQYRGTMINDLEIPFFIYSGKIIQNHQRGIGVFIKQETNNRDEEPEVKAINFVPPEETDHDIVHSFSSGQLSATVLSFTLALNKVYNQSGLNTILIDDPAQTMDEINMASLVELLRNDFYDKQIILSTHEDKISLYMRYKFSKFGLRAANINVKQELYEY
ncbi:exonuclease SbcC [Terribacillus halophilus]|uniref:Nuclease SbcCD subunit C n=1 Tax=Terribacillus halophilus TaxID=361279 RepID=A0A1G6QH05_9BACI|nr:AAA family ATPase [Terribacillus halophilus]SDC91603.1 exonuclease SbcC [Terribacillus halophilus]